MGNVGSGTLGHTLIGEGDAVSPKFEPIGTSSGLTNHGVVLAQGNSAFVASSAGTAGYVFTSNGAGADPTFQAVSPASSQTIVLAYLLNALSNVTGDGTGLIPLIFDATLQNTGSAYNTATGLFTAPRTGAYLVSCNVMFNNLLPAHTQGELIFNKPVGGGDMNKYMFNPGLVATSVAGYTNAASAAMSSIVTLIAGQTFRIGVVVRGSTKTVGLQDSNFSLDTALSIVEL